MGPAQDRQENGFFSRVQSLTAQVSKDRNEETTLNIAFLGLGNIGSAMAHRLLAAGHPLRVWDRSAAKMAPVVAAGASAFPSPAAAAEDAQFVPDG